MMLGAPEEDRERWERIVDWGIWIGCALVAVSILGIGIGEVVR